VKKKERKIIMNKVKKKKRVSSPLLGGGCPSCGAKRRQPSKHQLLDKKVGRKKYLFIEKKGSYSDKGTERKQSSVVFNCSGQEGEGVFLSGSGNGAH